MRLYDLDRRTTDALVTEAADGWVWLKKNNYRCLFAPGVVVKAIARDWVPLVDRDCLQWLIQDNVPRYSTDRDANKKLVERFQLRCVSEEYEITIGSRKGQKETHWLVTGGGISRTEWPDELLSVCVHVLRMSTAHPGR